jgi:hypothetical protein
MKNKITDVLGEDKLEHKTEITFPEIHVMDLTERTKGMQNLGIFNTKPDEFDALLIENPNLNITATFFKPQCFLNEKEEPDNCEGVFYLSNSNEKTWVLFIEIKDCKPKNISKYFTQAKEQVISVVQIFRNKGIISQDKKVHANISFPRKNKKDYFNQLFYGGEKKELLNRHKIFFRGTNHLIIKNETTIY